MCADLVFALRVCRIYSLATLLRGALFMKFILSFIYSCVAMSNSFLPRANLHSPAAYGLLFLSAGPYRHSKKGTGTPISVATSANSELPQPNPNF